ncbi:MAG: helix-turn-helix transcriptional regulator [Bergeyella sp.]
MSLGVKLRRYRTERNWSQAEVAERLGVSQPAYHLWETDQAKPTTENLLKISDVYGVDLFSLLESSSNVINNPVYNDNSSSVQQQYYPTINNQVPDGLLQSIQKNQQQITELYSANNNLLKALIEEIAERKK